MSRHNLSYRGPDDNPPMRTYGNNLVRDYHFKLHEFTH